MIGKKLKLAGLLWVKVEAVTPDFIAVYLQDTPPYPFTVHLHSKKESEILLLQSLPLFNSQSQQHTTDKHCNTSFKSKGMEF